MISSSPLCCFAVGHVKKSHCITLLITEHTKLQYYTYFVSLFLLCTVCSEFHVYALGLVTGPVLIFCPVLCLACVPVLGLGLGLVHGPVLVLVFAPVLVRGPLCR